MTTIRNCGPGDYDKVVNIYNHYVENSHATFDLVPFSVAERVPWFAQFGESGPHQLLVADRDGEVTGWCASTSYKDRAAYDVSVETTVYLDPEACGHGIGALLYRDLIERLGECDLHGAYAAIALPNDASVRLHESLGFERIGVFAEVGRKFDKYWDVAWFERRL